MMIEINFKFQGKDNVIKSSTTRLFKDVCEEFAKKVKADLDYLIFIYHDEKINLEMDYYVGQQLNLEFESDNKRVNILVYKSSFTVEFIYQGIVYDVGAKETEKMKEIFEKFEKKVGVGLVNVFFAYNGNIISNDEEKEKTLSQVINSEDRKRKGMSILVYDIERNSIISQDNIKIYNPVPQNVNTDNDNNPNAQSINGVQEDNLEDNYRNGNSNCFFKFLENLRPVYIILIQIGIIILFVGVGMFLEWAEYLQKKKIFLKVIVPVLFGICAIMSIILVIFFRFLKRRFESKWWYAYYIYYIPIIIIIIYIIPGDYHKLLLFFLFIMAFALFPVIILKGKKLKLFCLLILISNAIIIVPLALMPEKPDFTEFLFLSILSIAYDVYLGFVYHYSNGLFSFYDAKLSVLMYDYGFFAIIVYCFMKMLYPLYWLAKKCLKFFKSD